MEERINWLRLSTFKHSKRTNPSTGTTYRKHSKLYLMAKELIKDYINKQPNGDLSLAKISKDLDLNIVWVTEIMTELSIKHKLDGLEFTRGTSGVRCFYKNNRTPKEFKFDSKMFRSTYKPKIDHNLKRYIKSMGL